MIDDDPLTLFGLRLTELRKAKGWSQEWMALESGLARSYVSGIERGQRNLSLLNICRLAEALEVEPAALLKPPRPPKVLKSAKLKPTAKPKPKKR
jgi:transcriptional regulator with XRE-family HTH domain